MNNQTEDSTVIIGGGWAGLAAGVWLCTHNHPVRLFESAKQLGGRARCVAFAEQSVDNGQHLLLGAYHETLNVLRQCGADIEDSLSRRQLSLHVQDPQHHIFELATTQLPAPFNILAGLLKARGYSFKERLRTLAFMLKMHLRSFHLEKDISVKELLCDQPKIVIATLWEPLCIAALNTPINKASAQIFLNVVRDSFTQSASCSDLLLTSTDLGSLFVRPTMNTIESHGGSVHLAQRVTSLVIDNNKMSGIKVNDDVIPASRVILATPPATTERLVSGHEKLSDISQSLAQLDYQPICTVYLKYDESVSLPHPMLGLVGMTGQWLFDRAIAGQPGLIAVVISAEGMHMKLDKETLAQLVSDELSEHFGWPEPDETLVLREKRATFSAVTNIDRFRPVNTTPVEGLWLAGDYTRSPYPATLEAAVRSGLQCAKILLNNQ